MLLDTIQRQVSLAMGPPRLATWAESRVGIPDRGKAVVGDLQIVVLVDRD